jgi:cysteinyl-tRNA synthetase
MVNYWLHNGLMQAATAGKVGGRGEREREEADVDTKISRSKGAGGLADLIRRQGGERIRFFLLRTHYRSTIVFSEAGLEEAGVALETFHRFFDRYARISGRSFYELQPITRRSAGDFDAQGDPLLQEVAARRQGYLAKMDDDFNTGGAVSELFDLVRALNKHIDQQGLEDSKTADAAQLPALERGVATLRELTALLGLFRAPPTRTAAADDSLVGQLMQLLIELRTEARKKKDFATADRIRQGLQQAGIQLEDRKDGTGWRRESGTATEGQ